MRSNSSICCLRLATFTRAFSTSSKARITVFAIFFLGDLLVHLGTRYQIGRLGSNMGKLTTKPMPSVQLPNRAPRAALASPPWPGQADRG